MLLRNLLNSKTALSKVQNTCWTVGRNNGGLVGWERIVLGIMIREKNVDLKWEERVS